MMEVYRGLKRCLQSRERGVVATIIHVEGSTYRREGAACLLLEHGEVVGTLSAGCVESDLLEHARHVLQTGRPAVHRYDFRAEEDLLWGLGVGCNGAMQILLQPYDPKHAPHQAEQLFHIYEAKAMTREVCMSGVIIQTGDPAKQPVGSVFFLDQDEQQNLGLPAQAKGLYQVIRDEVEITLFAETIQPRTPLVICGAGPDAVPLVRGARALGWHVTVIDHRQLSLRHPVIADADEVVLVARQEYGSISVREDAYVVVMTHQYELDLMLLRRLMESPIPYLGVLGPRRRTEQILREISEERGRFDQDERNKLHAPVGLDIGADSPEEIALSILAEISSCRSGRSGLSLKGRSEPLHERRKEPLLAAKS